MFLIIFLILLSFSFPISLKEAEELALKNYPKIKELLLLSYAKKAEARAISLSRLGELKLFVGSLFYDDDYLLTPLASLPNPQSKLPFDGKRLFYGAEFSAPLYLGGSISDRVKIALTEREVFRNLSRLAEWQIRLMVSQAYLNYLSLQEYEKALKEYIKSLELLKHHTEEGVKLGKLAPVDLLKIEYDLEKTRALLKDTESRKLFLLSILETLTGIKIKKLEEYKVRYKPLEFSEDTLFGKAVLRSSAVKAKEAELKVAKLKEKLVRDRYGFRLKLHLKYTVNHGLKIGRSEDIGEINLTLSYPVFDWNKRKHEILSVKRIRLAKEKSLSEEKLKLRQKIAQSIYELTSIQANIKALKKRVTLAKEFERIEELKYLTGRGNIDDLLLAKSKRFLSQAELNSAYYSWEIALRKLIYLLEEDYEEEN
ncbi:TolC family protein [Aquifex sp.]